MQTKYAHPALVVKCVCAGETFVMGTDVTSEPAINSPVNLDSFYSFRCRILQTKHKSFGKNAHFNTLHLHKYKQSRFTIQQKWINAESCNIIVFIRQ